MGDLAERMNAGVGTARPLNESPFAGHRMECRGDRRLDRWTVVLDLPADKRCSVIFDCDGVAGHGLQTRRAPAAKGKPRRKVSRSMAPLP